MTSFKNAAYAALRPTAWLRGVFPWFRLRLEPAGCPREPVLHRETGAKLEGDSASEPGGGAAGAPGDWITPGRFTVLLALVTGLLFAGVLVGSQTFFFRDFGYFGLPLAQFHREAFWRGEWPLWNPLNNFGLPLLAQWNTLTLYPPSLLYLLLPLPWSLNVFCLAHLVLGGAGMYALAAHWTRQPLAAAVAGVAFAFNGLTLHCLMWPNNIAALGWLPWLVLLAGRAVREGGRALVPAACVGALQMLAGAPEVILLTWVVIGGLWLVEARVLEAGWARRLLAVGGRGIAVVGLVALLAAPQLLPFFELLGASQRSGGNYAGSDWPMPAWGWANLLVPLFRAFPSHHGVFAQTTQHWTSSYYAGIGVLVLAVWAAMRVRDGRVAWLAVVTFAGLVLALGDAGGLYGWVHRFFPAIEVMRYPVKFVLLASIALPLLAGFGVAQLLAAPVGQAVPGKRSLLVIGAAAVGLIGVIVAIGRLHPLADDVWSATWQSGLSRAILLVLILAAGLALRRVGCGGGTAGCNALRSIPALTGPALPCLFLLLLLADALTHTPWQNPTAAAWIYAPREVALEPRPIHGGARAMVSRDALLALHTSSINDPSRDYLFKRVALYDNCNLLDGLPKVDGVFSLYLREQADIHRLLYGGTNPPPAGLLDFLGVGHLTAPGKFVEWTSRPGWLPTATGGQRIEFAPAEETLAALANPAFDGRQTVFLPQAARGKIAATAGAGVRFGEQRWRAGAVDLEVEASAPTVIVLAQTFHPNWRATVNGSAVPVLRANHAFQAVPVPAGRSRVALAYRDDRFHAGLGIAGVTCAGCIAGWFVAGRGRRSSSAAATR